MEERHLGVELLPGIGDLQLIAKLVGERLLLVGIVEPGLEVEHQIGVAVGLVAVEAALVIVADCVQYVFLEVGWLMHFGVLVEID